MYQSTRIIFAFVLIPLAAHPEGPIWAVDLKLGDFFQQSADVGNPKIAGSAHYDAELQQYRLRGSGANMWLAQDQFQFAYRPQQGDFILRARVQFQGQGVDPHRKAGVMIRHSLAEDSPYVDVAFHGDGLVSLQYRRAGGAETEQVRAEVSDADVLQLEKKGQRFIMSVARFGQPMVSKSIEGIDLGPEVLAGIFVCAHNPAVVEECLFSNVRLVVPAPDDFVPYRDYIGSRLEILDLTTGLRRIIHEERDSLQAPNWTRDGQALIYNRNGRLYRLNLQTNAVMEIPTGFATNNNNDHALSFDGSQLAISHHAEEHERHSIVYTLPATGGTPQQITTSVDHSYLHGWSPDGKWLVFTGQRNGQLHIYKIPSSGGEETQLTDSQALDDGPEFTPDGEQIYFNSARSGRMQIWKMNSDGREQTAVIESATNDWFPHIAPDGKSLVYIAFPADIQPEEHPFYKQVTLCWRLLSGGPVRTLAYLYGGQGTMNVASWSPDGKRVAFVSNSVIE